MLIAVDDLQRLDPSSAAVLNFALRRLGHAPVRLLSTRRSGESAETLGSGGELPVRREEIGPLSLDQLGRLITRRTDKLLPRGGIIQEIGLVAKPLTRSRRAQSRLLSSFN